MKEIKGRKSRDIYYYDDKAMTLTDKEGNVIKLYESLDGISDNNLSLHIDDLFHKLYLISNDFKTVCNIDKETGIEWSDF